MAVGSIHALCICVVESLDSHGKGTFVTASDKQLALEARRRAVEEEFEKAIDQAKNVGLSKEEILEIVSLLLEEA